MLPLTVAFLDKEPSTELIQSTVHQVNNWMRALLQLGSKPYRNWVHIRLVAITSAAPQGLGPVVLNFLWMFYK